ncbi:hypothetical protein [Aquimarina rubra]|uniref:Uncharacterized protein n=1 Tax=Aquimarina rubra TaxID=1920033 RepID=A0ABW5LQP5_9FLAO
MKAHKLKDILNYILKEDDFIISDLLEAGNYNANEVIDYLKKGGKISSVSSQRECEICGKLAGSINYYTDGNWVWPEWITHYILDHRIKLPDGFIDHVKKDNLDQNLIQLIVNQDIEIELC